MRLRKLTASLRKRARGCRLLLCTDWSQYKKCTSAPNLPLKAGARRGSLYLAPGRTCYAYYDSGTPALVVPQAFYDSVKSCGEDYPNEMYEGSIAITIGSETPALKIPMSLMAYENGTINSDTLEGSDGAPVLGLPVFWAYDSVFESKNELLNAKFYEKNS